MTETCGAVVCYRRCRRYGPITCQRRHLFLCFHPLTTMMTTTNATKTTTIRTTVMTITTDSKGSKEPRQLPPPPPPRPRPPPPSPPPQQHQQQQKQQQQKQSRQSRQSRQSHWYRRRCQRRGHRRPWRENRRKFKRRRVTDAYRQQEATSAVFPSPPPFITFLSRRLNHQNIASALTFSFSLTLPHVSCRFSVVFFVPFVFLYPVWIDIWLVRRRLC